MGNVTTPSNQGKWQKLETKWTGRVHLQQNKQILSYVQYQARLCSTVKQKCVVKAVSKLTDSFHYPSYSCYHSFAWMASIFNLKHKSRNKSEMYQDENFIDVVLTWTDWPNMLVKESYACSLKGFDYYVVKFTNFTCRNNL